MCWMNIPDVIDDVRDDLETGLFSDDWILTKSDHGVMLMMEKTKNHITDSAEDKVLNIDQKDIEQYLSEVKEAVDFVIVISFHEQKYPLIYYFK